MSRPTDEQTHRVPAVEVRSPQEDEPQVRSAREDEEFEDVESQSIFSFLSSIRRKGEWEPADQIDVFACMGEVRLDFEHAILPTSGMIEIRATAIMGAIRISLPPGAEVEVKGFPLLGSFEQKTLPRRRARDVVRKWVTGEEPEGRVDEEPPLFRITGLAFMGEVDVRSR